MDFSQSISRPSKEVISGCGIIWQDSQNLSITEIADKQLSVSVLTERCCVAHEAVSGWVEGVGCFLSLKGIAVTHPKPAAVKVRKDVLSLQFWNLCAAINVASHHGCRRTPGRPRVSEYR